MDVTLCLKSVCFPERSLAGHTGRDAHIEDSYITSACVCAHRHFFNKMQPGRLFMLWWILYLVAYEGHVLYIFDHMEPSKNKKDLNRARSQCMQTNRIVKDVFLRVRGQHKELAAQNQGPWEPAGSSTCSEHVSCGWLNQKGSWGGYLCLTWLTEPAAALPENCRWGEW